MNKWVNLECHSGARHTTGHECGAGIMCMIWKIIITSILSQRTSTKIKINKINENKESEFTVTLQESDLSVSSRVRIDWSADGEHWVEFLKKN